MGVPAKAEAPSIVVRRENLPATTDCSFAPRAEPASYISHARSPRFPEIGSDGPTQYLYSGPSTQSRAPA